MVFGLSAQKTPSLAITDFAIKGNAGERIGQGYTGLCIEGSTKTELYCSGESFQHRREPQVLWILRESTPMVLPLANAVNLQLNVSLGIGENDKALAAFLSKTSATVNSRLSQQSIQHPIVQLLDTHPLAPGMTPQELERWWQAFSDRLNRELGLMVMVAGRQIRRGAPKTVSAPPDNEPLPSAGGLPLSRSSTQWQGLQTLLNSGVGRQHDTPQKTDRRIAQRLKSLLAETRVCIETQGHIASNSDDVLRCTRVLQSLERRQHTLPDWTQAKTDHQRERWVEAMDQAANESRQLQRLLRSAGAGADTSWRDMHQALSRIDKALDSRQRVVR